MQLKLNCFCAIESHIYLPWPSPSTPRCNFLSFLVSGSHQRLSSSFSTLWLLLPVPGHPPPVETLLNCWRGPLRVPPPTIFGKKHAWVLILNFRLEMRRFVVTRRCYGLQIEDTTTFTLLFQTASFVVNFVVKSMSTLLGIHRNLEYNLSSPLSLNEHLWSSFQQWTKGEPVVFCFSCPWEHEKHKVKKEKMAYRFDYLFNFISFYFLLTRKAA